MTASPPGPSRPPPDLLGFLEQLRREGFLIGIDEFESAQRVAERFAQRGVAELGSVLAPIVCTSEKQQDLFRERYQSWLQRGSESPPSLEELARRRRLKRLVFVGIGVLVALAVMTTGWLVFRPGAKPAGPVGPDAPAGANVVPRDVPARDPANQAPGERLAPPREDEVLVIEGAPADPRAGVVVPDRPPAFWIWIGILGTALVLTLIATWRRWLRKSARTVVTERAQTSRSPFRRLFLPRIESGLLDDGTFAKTAAEFRRHRRARSTRIDVTATLRKTLREGEHAELVLGTRKISPEYFVLVDRNGLRDHLAWFLEEIVERFRTEGVYLDLYEFRGTPRTVWRPGLRHERSEMVTLPSLASRHPEYRLVIFGPAESLMDRTTGRLAGWAETCRSWECRVLFTPAAPVDWGFAEDELRRAGFQVLPADQTGMRRFIETVNGLRHSMDWIGASTPRVPDAIWTIGRDRRGRPRRHPPGDEQIKGAVASLRRYLDPPGFLWLSACAVAPSLEWGFTMCLGHTLRTREGERLFSPERLAALARLPWFREGSLPDWLRPHLVAALPAFLGNQARQVITHLLLEVTPEEGLDRYELGMVELRSAAGPDAEEAVEELVRAADEESAVGDPTLATFLTGRSPQAGSEVWLERMVGTEMGHTLRQNLISLSIAMIVFFASLAWVWVVYEDPGFWARALSCLAAFYALGSISLVFRRNRIRHDTGGGAPAEANKPKPNRAPA